MDQFKNFNDVMLNWQYILNTSFLKIAESSSNTSKLPPFSSIPTLPKSSIKSDTSTDSIINPPSSLSIDVDDKSGKSSGSSSSLSSTSNSRASKNATKKSNKSKVKKQDKESKKPLNVFESIGNVSNDIVQELQHGNEGFDLLIAQTVCDDSRPLNGEEASSYFLMRHAFSYPGPWSTMMQGPAALTSYGYRLSAEAVNKDKYVLVGTLNQNTIEGVWEYTYNKYIKTHVTFLAGFQSQQQQAMAMMMGGGPKLPSAICYADFKWPTLSSRVRVDMMNNELSLSLNRKITNDFMLGARLITNYESRRTVLEFGGKYSWFNKNKGSNKHEHTIEGMFNKDANMLSLFYTHSISDNIALTSRLMWSVGASDKIMTSIGYKYSFGRIPMAGKSVLGDISSDGTLRQTISFPLLQNMLVKIFAEMNHFLTPERLQRGEFPHKFGIQVHVHL